jgi:hypothetical protein
MNRCSKNGVLDRVFEKLQREQIARIRIEAFSLDSTSVKVHPDGTGARKNGPQAIGKSRSGWDTKIHIVAAAPRTALSFSLSAGETTMLRRAGCCSKILRSWADAGRPAIVDG